MNSGHMDLLSVPDFREWQKVECKNTAVKNLHPIPSEKLIVNFILEPCGLWLSYVYTEKVINW